MPPVSVISSMLIELGAASPASRTGTLARTKVPHMRAPLPWRAADATVMLQERQPASPV